MPPEAIDHQRRNEERKSPFEVVSKKGKGRITESGRIGLALLDEVLQLIQFRRVHGGKTEDELTYKLL